MLDSDRSVLLAHCCNKPGALLCQNTVRDGREEEMLLPLVGWERCDSFDLKK